MPSIASIGTYLPCRGTRHGRAVGDGEDAAVDIGPAAARLDTPVLVAGVDHDKVGALCTGEPPQLPTTGASPSLFALAALAESDTIGPLVAVEQASLSGITVTSGEAQVIRCERGARPFPPGTVIPGTDLQISHAVDKRAFEAKVRWEAGKFANREGPDSLPRYRFDADGTLSTDDALVPQVIADPDGVAVQAPVMATGSELRTAQRYATPDYGNDFEPVVAA